MNHPHFQTIAQALSDLFNTEDITPAQTRSFLHHAWRVAGIADCCEHCDNDVMVWPWQVDADGAATYRCAAGHTWQCWWAPNLLNTPC